MLHHRSGLAFLAAGLSILAPHMPSLLHTCASGGLARAFPFSILHSYLQPGAPAWHLLPPTFCNYNSNARGVGFIMAVPPLMVLSVPAVIWTHTCQCLDGSGLTFYAAYCTF
jgi:hypothetical protein